MKKNEMEKYYSNETEMQYDCDNLNEGMSKTGDLLIQIEYINRMITRCRILNMPEALIRDLKKHRDELMDQRNALLDALDRVIDPIAKVINESGNADDYNDGLPFE